MEQISRKGILEFNLEDFDAAQEFSHAIKGSHYHMKIETLHDEVLRQVTKYRSLKGYDKKLTDGQIKVLDLLIEQIHEHFKEE